MLRETLKQAGEKNAEMKASTAISLEDAKATMGRLQEEKGAAEADEEKTKAIVEEKATAVSEKQQLTKAETKRHQDTKIENELVMKE